MKLFRERFPLLTNMAPVAMKVNGKIFSCCEAAFQSFKAVVAERHDLVDQFVGVNGFTAKRLGKTVPLKPYLEVWNEVRVDIMWQLLLIKVQDSSVRQQLISADDEELVENNTWGDTFWGVVEKPDGTMIGRNVLGRLWQGVKKIVLLQPDASPYTSLPCPIEP